MHVRVRIAAGVLAAGVVLAGCSGGTGSDETSTASSAAPSVELSSATSSSISTVTSTGATGAASGDAAATGGGTTVPVSVVPVTNDASLNGATIATAQVTVGGGAPITVRIDTGSSGLLINSSVAGPQTTNTGQRLGVEFSGSSISGTIGQAQVSIGGVSTAGPIGVGLVDENGTPPGTFAGTDGLLGIGTSNSGTSIDSQVYAPTMQLPSPANEGVLLDLTGGSSGTMQLGPVTAPAGAATLPLSPIAGATYPSGTQGYDRMVQLCWTVGTAASNCAPTDIDLGDPVVGLNSTIFTSLGVNDSILPAGQPVAIATSTGQSLWSFTSGSVSSLSPETLLLTTTGDATYNAGIGLFLQGVIGIDYRGGHIVIAPKS